MHEAMAKAGANAYDDPVGALAAQGRAYIAFARSRPEHYRLMFMRRPGHDLEMPTEAEISATAGLSSVIETIRVAQQRGVLNDADDPTRVALSLWAAVHGVAALLIAKPHFPWGDTGDLIDCVVAMTLYGVLPR